jgi:hypothetical protein
MAQFGRAWDWDFGHGGKRTWPGSGIVTGVVLAQLSVGAPPMTCVMALRPELIRGIEGYSANPKEL